MSKTKSKKIAQQDSALKRAKLVKESLETVLVEARKIKESLQKHIEKNKK